ncbi:MAG: response regulator [Eubacteriales bacterium]|nr:response regulator [Eubacteriales bacterium]
MYHAVIVDDDKWALADIRQSFRFSHWGFDVTGEYQNASDAFSFIEANPPDLVVSDIKMGEMSGLDLARKCHEHQFDPVFIIVSGYDSFAYVQDAFRYGVFFYLLKPIDDDQVAEVMEKAREKLDERSKNRRVYSDDALGRALQYIDEHCCEHLTLDRLAAAMFMNPSYLSQLISKGVGIPFVSYRNKQRVEQAKALMAQGQHNVSILAENIGFVSPGQFFKVFKQETSMSPQQYINAQPSEKSGRQK